MSIAREMIYACAESASAARTVICRVRQVGRPVLNQRVVARCVFAWRRHSVVLLRVDYLSRQ